MSKRIINKIKLFIAHRRKRRVILISYDKDTKIVEATRSQCGWVANWYSHNDSTVSILLPDGTTTGYSLIHNWLPHSGWDEHDLQALKNKG